MYRSLTDWRNIDAGEPHSERNNRRRGNTSFFASSELFSGNTISFFFTYHTVSLISRSLSTISLLLYLYLPLTRSRRNSQMQLNAVKRKTQAFDLHCKSFLLWPTCASELCPTNYVPYFFFSLGSRVFSIFLSRCCHLIRSRVPE